MARKLKIMENEKYPLDDQKNDEITKKDRKSVVQGKSVDLGGRRIIKKKNRKGNASFLLHQSNTALDHGKAVSHPGKSPKSRAKQQEENTDRKSHVFFFKQKTAYEILA